METIIGICGKNFVMIAADKSSIHDFAVMRTDDKKVYCISNKIIIGITGSHGDAHQFAEYIIKNLQLYKMRNNYELSFSATAHFIRQNLAEYLRSQTPYTVNLLLGGYDNEDGGQLFYMDFLGASQKVPFASHGIGGLLTLSILDRYCKPDITEEEAYEVMKKCVAEIQRRFVISLPNFYVKLVNGEGTRDLEDITMATVK